MPRHSGKCQEQMADLKGKLSPGKDQAIPRFILQPTCISKYTERDEWILIHEQFGSAAVFLQKIKNLRLWSDHISWL